MSSHPSEGHRHIPAWGSFSLKIKIKRQDLGGNSCAEASAGQCSAGGPHGHGTGRGAAEPGPAGHSQEPRFASCSRPRPGRRPRKKLRVRPAESERRWGPSLGGSGILWRGGLSPGAAPRGDHPGSPHRTADRQPGGAAGAEGRREAAATPGEGAAGTGAARRAALGELLQRGAAQLAGLGPPGRGSAGGCRGRARPGQGIPQRGKGGGGHGGGTLPSAARMAWGSQPVPTWRSQDLPGEDTAGRRGRRPRGEDRARER